jgi:hypothetical protein
VDWNITAWAERQQIRAGSRGKVKGDRKVKGEKGKVKRKEDRKLEK